MKANALTTLSLAFIASALALGGCTDIDSKSQDVAGTASEEGMIVASEPQMFKGDATISPSALSACPFGTGCTWPGQDATGAITVYSFSGSGGAGVCNTISRNVATVVNTYGGGVIGFALFPTTDCTGAGIFSPTGAGNATSISPILVMRSYKILR